MPYDLTCADCNAVMYRVAKSLPQGVARCHSCRRVRPTVNDRRTPCARCGTPSLGVMCRACDNLSRQERKAKRLAKPKSRQVTARVHSCRRCGNSYLTTNPNQRYCSVKCKQRSTRSGTTQSNGYGQPHQRERERLRPMVDAGLAYCTEPVCLMGSRWIEPGTRWDLAHDRATGAWRGPAHQRCNRSEGATWKQTKAEIPSRWAL